MTIPLALAFAAIAACRTSGEVKAVGSVSSAQTTVFITIGPPERS